MSPDRNGKTRTKTQTALSLGPSGKIGRRSAAAFQAAGWTVKRYTRGQDMTRAAMGCDVIVNGLNPPAYHDWKTLLPRITAQVIAASKASGATVLFPGNVYAFGDQPGPWSETTPHRPCSRKGEIRAQVEAAYRAAADADVRTILLRAGDFLTPEVSDSFVNVIYLRAFHKGVITTLGDPDAPRAHAWLPDMAHAGVMLAGMRYLYSTPHRLDDGLFKRLLPDFRATPLDDALLEILALRAQSAKAA